jgi:chromosomal replication initiation ATPase DnaA
MAMDKPMFIAQYVPKLYETNKTNLNHESFNLNEDFSDKSAEEMVHLFEHLSFYCAQTNTHITDERLDKIIKNVIDKLHDMTGIGKYFAK